MIHATDIESHPFLVVMLTSECKSLWGEPERVHRISAVNIQDECTVLGMSILFRGWIVAAELNDKQPLVPSWKEK